MPPKPEGKRAVVHWIKDDKAGIEPISSIPPGSRFEGSVTTVQFSGDKKWYPAKVILISDNSNALAEKEMEVAEKILEQRQINDKSAPARTRKGSKARVVSNVASERDVALALGSKPPIPKHLDCEQKAAVKSKKDARDHYRRGQNVLDENISNKIKKKLFASSSNKDSTKENESYIPDEEDDEEGRSETARDSACIDDSDEQEGEEGGTSDESTHEEELTSKSKWCECIPCLTLQKYDNPTYISFLKDIVELYEDGKEAESLKHNYLKLQQLPEGVRQVEITAGSGIYIPLSVKDQLKVDHKNSPSSLIRETLFALFGKQPFRHLLITARGNKHGTYGIRDDILTAVTAFVNRHVESKKMLKLTKVVAIINKRAQEWRKTPSPKVQGKTKRKNTLIEAKVTSTSPFKVVTLTPMKDEQHTIASRISTPQKIPSPRKSPTSMKNFTNKKTVTPLKLRSPIKPACPAQVNPAGPPQTPAYYQPHYESYSRPSSSTYIPPPSSLPSISYPEMQWSQQGSMYWQEPPQYPWGSWSREEESAPQTTFQEL